MNFTNMGIVSTYDLCLLMVVSILAICAWYTTPSTVKHRNVAQALIRSSAVVGIGLLYWLNQVGNLPVPVTNNNLGATMLLLLCVTFVTRLLFPEQQKVEDTTPEPQDLLAQIPVGVLLLGEQGEILFSNPTACQLLERTKTELCGKTAFGADWQVVQADGAPFSDASVLKKPLQNLVLGIYRASGDRIWLLVNTQPQLVADGSVKHTTCTFSDITERQQAEITLRQSQSSLEKQSNVLVALARRKTLGGDLNTALKEITETAARTLQVERVSVWLFNKDRSQFYCINLYEQTANRHTFGLKLATADYPAYFQALEIGRSIAADDAHTDPRTREFWATHLSPLGITSMLDAPIWLNGEMVGVVCHEHIGSRRNWTLDEQNFAGSIADLVSLCMEGNQRQRAEQALRQSEAKLQKLATNVPGIIYQFLLRPDGSYSFPYVSPYSWEVHGLEPEAIQENADLVVGRIHPDDRPSYDESVAASAQTLQPWTWEGRFINPNGEIKWLQGASRPEKLPNGDILWDGLLFDITAAKQTEEALRKSEERFRRLSEATFEGILVHQDGKILDANQALAEMLGYELSELITINPLQLLAPESRDFALEKLLTRYEKPYEALCLKKDGSVYPVEIQGKYVSYQEGTARLTAVRDVRERKRVELELAKRERYLAAVVEVQRRLLADNTGTGDPLDSSYTYILETLGRASVASRVYLFENHRDQAGRLLMSQRAEWRATTVQPQVDNLTLQNLPYQDCFARWAEVLGRGEIIAGIVAELPEAEREFLLAQGILSILVLPLRVNGEFFGFIGFDNCLEARPWDALEVDFLAAAAAAISLHQERSKAQKALFTAKDELEIRVEERTKALIESNQQLLIEIAERAAADIALQESEAKFRQLAQQEELLNSLATQIRNSLDLDTILETTVQEISKLLQIDRCSFAWYRPGVGEAGNYDQGIWEVVKEVRHPGLPDLTGTYPASAVGLLAKKLFNLEMIRIDDVKQLNEPTLQQFLVSLGTQSKLALPIQTRSGEIGVLLFSNCRKPRHWEDSEVELLSAVTNQLAIAIDQSFTLAQAQQAAQIAEAKNLELQQAQAQLVQSEKMSSLGNLVAGVAHEINNPVSFISGNLTYATEYIRDFLDILHLYQENYPQPVPAIVERSQAVDLGFLIDDLPKILTSMQVGADRISKIVLSLRNFSRLDEAEMKCVNLHEGIDSTLLILQNRLKSNAGIAEIEIVKEYGDLPLVECYPGKLNQVFMNILSNAIDALSDLRTRGAKEQRSWGAEESINSNSPLVRSSPCLLLSSPSPTISIRTQVSRPGYVAVRIADNGPGMEEHIKSQVFDPFFTTKPVGSGTGLGLSISYQIVVENHKGVLKCDTQPRQGAEFWIEIPIRQSCCC